jgi:hypothetical protein
MKDELISKLLIAPVKRENEVWTRRVHGMIVYYVSDNVPLACHARQQSLLRGGMQGHSFCSLNIF